MKKRNKKYRPATRLVNPILEAMNRASKLTAPEKKVLTDMLDNCFDLLRRGEWDPEEFKRLADVFNLAQVLTRPGFGLLPDHIEKFSNAQDVLAALAVRRSQGKGWTCYAQELAPLSLAIEFHTIQLDFVSVGELERAAKTVVNFHEGAQSGSVGRGHIVSNLDEVAA